MAADAGNALPARRAAALARRDESRPPSDSGAEPITYEGTAEGDPTWETLPLAVRQLVERDRLVERPSIASFVAPPEVRSSRDGSSRRSIVAWRLDDQEQLLLIEAAQSIDERKPQWRVRVATLGDLQIQRASMLAVPPPPPSGEGTTGSGPASVIDGYRGAVPEVWANLPRRVRDALDVAVPLETCRTEEGAARLWFKHTGAGVAIVEKVWYGRHGRNRTLSAVFAQRSAPSAQSGVDAASMRIAVHPAPWSVIAFRVTVDWRNARRLGAKRKSLGRGGPKALNPGLERRELVASTHDDGSNDGTDGARRDSTKGWNPFRRG